MLRQHTYHDKYQVYDGNNSTQYFMLLIILNLKNMRGY